MIINDTNEIAESYDIKGETYEIVEGNSVDRTELVHESVIGANENYNADQKFQSIVSLNSNSGTHSKN